MNCIFYMQAFIYWGQIDLVTCSRELNICCCFLRLFQWLRFSLLIYPSQRNVYSLSKFKKSTFFFLKLLSHVQLFASPSTIQSMEFSRPEYWSGQPFPSPGDLPNPGIEPMSPTLQAVYLPAEPQGKPKYTTVGSPSLLQPIFLTQEAHQGLLHCRQILYQQSYEGSQESLLAQNKSTSTWENMNLKCIGRYTQLCWTI